jgi:hypothetical protein
MCMYVSMYKESEVANIGIQLEAVNSQLTAFYREKKVIICIHIYVYEH